MKIEKIEKKKSGYKIIIDDGNTIYTYEEVIINNGLLYHKYLNNDLLKKIYKDTAYYKNYNKILEMISKKMRSENEIRKYLKKSEVVSEDMEKMIENLRKANLINDFNYAKAYTNDKINLSMDGPNKIKRHLQENKIDNDIIEKVVNVDENVINSRLDKIITKKISNNTKYTPNILKQKITNYLINQGYEKSDILNRLDSFEIKKVPSTKEMDKILNRLRKKHNGKELLYKLKNNLYSKGYTREEIDNYIEKNSSLF